MFVSSVSNRAANQTDAELWENKIQKDKYWQADEHFGFVGKPHTASAC